ncbi:sensor histidine kinase [Anaerocolumna aminovalerica]|uniref:sensor histidine kinase n=1 Tax=Anaerocolumna aminovalerica TaxID=1527 RepID=UPI00248D39B0|nr:sensor histidine kinase [Anaerocolumna aminovalerica]
MNIESYDVIYILGNLFMAFVIFKYIHIFYSDCKVNIYLERLAYIGYFLLITFTHIFPKIPLIVMATNLIILFLLTLLYEGKIKKAVLSVAIIYFSLMSIETIVVFLTCLLELNLLAPFDYMLGFGIFTIRILSFVFVLFVQGFKNVKTEYPLPNIYWFSLITVPFGTIVMLFAIFINHSISRSFMFVCMGSAFAINIVTFYLYDKISALLISQMNKRIMEEQNRYYEYQVQMMKSTLSNLRVLQHDFKNKLSPLYGLAKTGKTDELLEQLSELTHMCQISKEYVTSGNSTIDSIINFKLQQAEKQNIKISSDILIPVDLSISIFDIAIILGNLLDNALKAVSNIDDRWIDIKIKHTKGRLIIEINNSYDGIVKKAAFKFLSRKEDQKNHGIGLKSIQAAVHKYDGTMRVTHDEKRFQVKILMYLQSNNLAEINEIFKCTNGKIGTIGEYAEY